MPPVATLSFNLPEENDEFKTATEAGALLAVIEDLKLYLRNKVKYAPDGANETEIETYEKIREEIYDLCKRYNLSL